MDAVQTAETLSIVGDIEHLLDEHPARTAPSPGPRRGRHLFDTLEAAGGDLGLDRFLGNAKAGTDQGPLTRKLADHPCPVIGKCRPQCRNSRNEAMLTSLGKSPKPIENLRSQLIVVEPRKIAKLTSLNNIAKYICRGGHIPASVRPKRSLTDRPLIDRQ